MRRQSSFAPTRRRRSPVPMLLLILVVLFFGFLIYLGMRNNEVPVETLEQDVTNEVLAR